MCSISPNDMSLIGPRAASLHNVAMSAPENPVQRNASGRKHI